MSYCRHGHVEGPARKVCGSGDIVEATKAWVEPLCKEHYAYWLRRAPRTELRFADGHREIRNNFVYGDIYRDVETEFDGDTGSLVPHKVTYFEREDVYRDESGKIMLLFYREIPDPTPRQVKAVNALLKTGTNKPMSKWRKFTSRVRVWFAMRGVG